MANSDASEPLSTPSSISCDDQSTASTSKAPQQPQPPRLAGKPSSASGSGGGRRHRDQHRQYRVVPGSISSARGPPPSSGSTIGIAAISHQNRRDRASSCTTISVPNGSLATGGGGGGVGGGRGGQYPLSLPRGAGQRHQQVASTASAFDLRRMFRVDSAISLLKYATGTATGSPVGSTLTLADQEALGYGARPENYEPPATVDSPAMNKQIKLVQDSDACFFENFGCLGSRLEQAKRDFINRPAKRRRPGARRLSFTLARFQKPNDHFKDDLYLEVLYTICHRVGAGPSATSEDKLFTYAQKAFGACDERHRVMLTTARQEKPPVIILNVVVVEATGLVAKDIDGYSDPFCMLGIVPGRRNSAVNVKPPPTTLVQNDSGNTLTLDATLDSGHSSPNTTDHETGTSTSFNETVPAAAAQPAPAQQKTGSSFIRRVKGSFRRRSKRGDSTKSSASRPGDEDLTLHRKIIISGRSSNSSTNAVDVEDDHHETMIRRDSSLFSRIRAVSPPRPAPEEPEEDEEEVGAVAANEVIPAKLIKATSVQPNTLQPTWNEKFQLVVDDPTTDRFHLDIWDHDDETSVVEAVGKLNEVNSLRGLGRYFKDVAQTARAKSLDATDDFLGSITINCKHVTAKGLDEWFKLMPRSEKSKVSGEIRLKLWLGTREERNGHDDGDNLLDIQQHIHIIKCFAHHEIRHKHRGDASKWQGNFTDEATCIMHQHAIQGDLTDTQKALCQWIAHCWLHFYETLHYGFLYELLTSLMSKWEPTNLTKDEEEMLAECLAQFQTIAYTQLVQHRDAFAASSSASQSNFEHLLKCLHVLHDNANFARVLPFQRDLYTELVTITQRSAVHFFHRAKSIVQAHENAEPDDSYGPLAKLITLLNGACTCGLSTYAPPFQRVTGIDYFTLTYMEFDELLQDELFNAQIAENFERKSLQVLDFTSANAQQSVSCQRILIPLFELHITLSEFIGYRRNCDPESGSKAQVRSFSQLFERAASKYLLFAKQLLIARIDLACSLDKHIQAESTEIRQSTSYVDVCYTIKQLLDFWDHLVIGNQSKKAAFNERLVQLICQALEYYTDKLFTALAHSGFYDEGICLDDDGVPVKQFCVTVNDAEQARRVVSDLSDKLHTDDITNALQLKQDKTAALKWRSSLEHLIDSCRSCIAGQMDMAMDRLIQLQSELYAKNIFHMAWSPKGCDIEGAMQPLLDLLDKHMSDYHQWLLHRNFVRYLNVQFKCILELLDKTVCENEGQSDEFHRRLADALAMLTDFFHAGGRGLSMETIAEIPVYRKLNKTMKLYATPTAKLIERYYQTLLEQQQTLADCKYGILNVRVYFNAIADLLVVDVLAAKRIMPQQKHVLSAKRIIPLDSNGLSDPFVIVEIVPNYCFPQCPVVKTKVVSKTLNPVYEETFEFTVYEHELPDVAMIHFVVMDYDLLRSNDFAGEAFIDLSDVPGFGIVDDKTAKEVTLRQFNLVLMHPDDNDQEILTVLKNRVDDERAVDFCKHVANVRYT